MGPLLDLLLHGLELAFPSSLLVCFFGIFPTFPRTIWIATLHDEADVLGAFTSATDGKRMGSAQDGERRTKRADDATFGIATRSRRVRRKQVSHEEEATRTRRKRM